MGEQHQVMELMCETCGTSTRHLQVPGVGWSCVACEARRRASVEAVPPAPVVLELDCGACGKRTLHQRRNDTGAMVCVDCRARAEAQPPVAKPAATSHGVAVLLMLGGALAAVGVFLPWLSIGAISRSGMDMTGGGVGDAHVILGLSIGAALLALDAPLGSTRRVVALLVALSIIVVAGIDYQEMRDRVASLGDNPFAAAVSVGIGLYACLAGGALAAIGAVTGK